MHNKFIGIHDKEFLYEIEHLRSMAGTLIENHIIKSIRKLYITSSLGIFHRNFEYYDIGYLRSFIRATFMEHNIN
jgi:hypothetical protein